jgi:uncharacterized protein
METASLETAYPRPVSSGEVLPTVRDRNHTLDVLRGIAVLGILLANIGSFAAADLGGIGGMSSFQGTEKLLDTLMLVFVNGKFRSMLAILFGIGVWMQYQKRSQVEGNWPGGYIKRSIWLGVIGLCHGLFIWFGDILFFYSGMAIVTALLVKVDSRILRAIIWSGVVINLLCSAGLAAAMAISPAAASESSGFFWSEQDLRNAFQSGTYLQQFHIRAGLFAIMRVC